MFCRTPKHTSLLVGTTVACGDGDELAVWFNRSSLLFETTFKWFLYFQSVDNNPRKMASSYEKSILVLKYALE